MGNRAVLAFSKAPKSVGIYLHWNGGIESVEAFLEVCRLRGYRSPAEDKSYAMARLIGVCHEFFDSGLSLGVGPLCELDVDNWDNGAYLIGPDWKVSERWGKGSKQVFKSDNPGKTAEIVEWIITGVKQ
jgi:hypothetical protein